MGIEVRTDFSADALQGFFNRCASLIKTYMLRALTKLGEECVVRVRDRSQDVSWIDHTSNLRSSIGYAVYDYGVKYMESAFNVLGSGSEGQRVGKQIVNELAHEYSNVYALVVVAGMDYAEYVEKIESKDVLESTKLWALSVVSERLERAKEEAIKVIDKWQL